MEIIKPIDGLYYIDKEGATVIENPNRRYGPASSRTVRIKAISPDQVKIKIQKSYDEIESILSQIRLNQQALDCNLYCWDTNHFIEVHVNPSCTIQDYVNSEKIIDFIDGLRHKNIGILSKLNGNQDIYDGDWFSSSASGTNVFNRRKITLYKIQFILVDICKNCGSPVARDMMNFHSIHPECDLIASKTTAEKDGLVLLNFDDGLYAKEAGLKTAMVPTRYDLYAEPWVRDAIEIWNAKDSSYADMTLAEFLQKMRPNS